MQCIKESSTLRVLPKKEKPSTRICFHYGKQDNEIKSFLLWRRRIKKADKKRISVLTSLHLESHPLASVNHPTLTKKSKSKSTVNRRIKNNPKIVPPTP